MAHEAGNWRPVAYAPGGLYRYWRRTSLVSPLAFECLSNDVCKRGLAFGLLILFSPRIFATAALFASDDALEVELRGPISKLLADTSNRQRPFQIDAGDGLQAVTVGAGGRSRRSVCEFLPLRLDFDAAGSDSATGGDRVFSDHAFLYLTTQCRDTRRSRADLIEEYLAYRILNLITERSYRVRLLQITYLDNRQDDARMTHYAFVTESQHALAQRIGGEVLAINSLPKRRLNEEHAAMIYIFQYLIGNTDWSLVAATGDETCCHNGQLIGIGEEIFYVPFDFDMAGLVNPPYARPDRSLRIRKVTDRVYRGYCGPGDALASALETIIAKRGAIINLYSGAEALSPRERERGIDFLDRFFHEAQEPGKLLAKFQQGCLG